LLHVREADLATDDWKRDEPAMQSGGNDIHFALKRAFQLGKKAAFFQVGNKLGQFPAKDSLRLPATVAFHPMIPTADLEVEIGHNNAVGSKSIDPLQGRRLQLGVRFVSRIHTRQGSTQLAFFPLAQLQQDTFQRSHPENNDQITTHVAGAQVKAGVNHERIMKGLVLDAD
jgi:hypothetical protein